MTGFWHYNKLFTAFTILDLLDAVYLETIIIIATENLSSTEACWYHREDGTMGRGKRGSKASAPAFFLFPSSPARLLFLLGYSAGTSLEERATETLVHANLSLVDLIIEIGVWLLPKGQGLAGLLLVTEISKNYEYSKVRQKRHLFLQEHALQSRPWLFNLWLALSTG